MELTPNNDKKAEFGDFQTPPGLAAEVCSLLNDLHIIPTSIVEPTCGQGNFLLAALDAFPDSRTAIGVDISSEYVEAATGRLVGRPDSRKLKLHCENFFRMDWAKVFSNLVCPILVVGNPPWITNSDLGALNSENLPTKTNFQKYSGFDALTGKSNFDISEWMITHLLGLLHERAGVLAMLCKTAVARKVLSHAWKNNLRVQSSALYLIDADKHFEASVDACLLVCHTGGANTSFDCRVFGSLQNSEPSHIFGYRDNQLVAEVGAYDAWKQLQGTEHYKWRSGIKHDCSGVMELRRIGDSYENGLGKRVVLESQFLYPMLKSSDLANGNVSSTDRYMLVPQLAIGADTSSIQEKAPLTWAYLQEYGPTLDRRGSSIYKERPRFSIFGVGSYSFAPWKVAISGFYKSLRFCAVGPICGKPMVFDDTCNFISCQSEDEATCMAELLNSPATSEFLKAFIFWDAKRPLTIDLLKRIDLLRVAEASGKLLDAEKFVRQHDADAVNAKRGKYYDQPSLFTTTSA
jgi:hypothetical protein